MFRKEFTKNGVDVLISSDRGIYTFEKIAGVDTYLEWDDRYGEVYEDEVRCDGYGCSIDRGGWRVGGFPESENPRREVYAARHLFTLLDFCKEKKITFHDYSGKILENTVMTAWRKELHETMKKEDVEEYLRRLRKSDS
jgi:hypothetical protein